MRRGRPSRASRDRHLPKTIKMHYTVHPFWACDSRRGRPARLAHPRQIGRTLGGAVAPWVAHLLSPIVKKARQNKRFLHRRPALLTAGESRWGDVWLRHLAAGGCRLGDVWLKHLAACGCRFCATGMAVWRRANHSPTTFKMPTLGPGIVLPNVAQETYFPAQNTSHRAKQKHFVKFYEFLKIYIFKNLPPRSAPGSCPRALDHFRLIFLTFFQTMPTGPRPFSTHFSKIFTNRFVLNTN